MILEELSKQDKLWREIAMNITKGDKYLADEITQNMYLKLMKYTEFNTYFVALTLKNLYIDIQRQKKNVSLAEFHYIEDKQKQFEPNDQQQEYLENINNLQWYQQELLKESFNHSTRQIADRYNINYGFVHREIHKALKEVLGDDYQYYNNSNLKHKR